jgi:two-component system response regulator
MRALSVLLIEDNEIDAEIAKRVIAKTGIAVSLQVARDGEEALEILFQPPGDGDQRERPRLVLLDLRLPGIDGREILRRIKRHAELCVIPVAVLTGVRDNRLMMECLELGGNMYFVKPITESEAANLLPAISKYWGVMEKLQAKNQWRGEPDERAAGRR